MIERKRKVGYLPVNILASSLSTLVPSLVETQVKCRGSTSSRPVRAVKLPSATPLLFTFPLPDIRQKKKVNVFSVLIFTDECKCVKGKNALPHLREYRTDRSRPTGPRCCCWRHSYKKTRSPPGQTVLGQMETRIAHIWIDTQEKEKKFNFLKTITSMCSQKAFLFKLMKQKSVCEWFRMQHYQLTWSATKLQVESSGPAAAERQQWAERRKRCCSWPGPHLSHNLTGQSTRRQNLREKGRQEYKHFNMLFNYTV